MAQAVLRQAPLRPPGRPTRVTPLPARTAQPAAPVAAPSREAIALRRQHRLQLTLWLAVVYAGVSLGLLFFQGGRLYRHSQVLAREWRQESLKHQQGEQALARANTPEELERLARERLGFVRPDEVAVKLVSRQ